MHNSKSAEYLDKINETFAQLSDPPHEIEIDSLLGYIRIFYSSIKSLPIDDSSRLDAEMEITSAEQREIKADVIDTPPIIEPEAEVPEAEVPEVEVAKEAVIATPVEAETDIEALDEPNNITEQTESSPEINTEEEVRVTAEPEAQQEVESANDSHEDITVIEDIPFVEIEAESTLKQEDIQDQSQKMPEPIEEKPFVRDNTKVEIPIVTQESIGREESMLSKIESRQNEPRYVSDSERDFEASDAIESIFRDKSPSGLVDFLGLSPLSDLNKAWGLNERLLIIKDLFGDDLNIFNQTIEAMNKCANFAEAKSWLIQNIANQYEWTDLGKYKKASNFVTQVKRLFVK